MHNQTEIHTFAPDSIWSRDLKSYTHEKCFSFCRHAPHRNTCQLHCLLCCTPQTRQAMTHHTFFSRCFAMLVATTIGFLCLTSCFDLSYEPKPSTDKLFFSAEGGTQHVEIHANDGSPLQNDWTFGPIAPYPADYQEVDHWKKHSTVDTLSNGDIRYTSFWLSVVVSKDKKHMDVSALPNPSTTPRQTSIYGAGEVSGFKVHCYQGGKPATTASTPKD